MIAPTLRQIVEGLSLGFEPRTHGPGKTLEFEAAGERPRYCHLVIENDSCHFAPGPADKPSVRLRTEGATLRAIGSRELEIATAIREGRLAVDGDIESLRLLKSFRLLQGEALRDPIGFPPGPVHLSPTVWLAIAFVPWAIFWGSLWLNSPSPGALVGFALALLLGAYRRIFGGLTFFEVGTMLALALSTVLPIEQRGILFGTSFAELSFLWALGAAVRPLGLCGEYTRWKFVPILSKTALFRYPNAVISLAWALGFLANALVTLFPLPRLLPIPSSAAHVITFTACAVYTTRKERGAREERIDDIDRRLIMFRRTGFLLSAIAAAVVVWVLLKHR